LNSKFIYTETEEKVNKKRIQLRKEIFGQSSFLINNYFTTLFFNNKTLN